MENKGASAADNVIQWLQSVCSKWPAFASGSAKMHLIGSRACQMHHKNSDFNFAVVSDESTAALRAAFVNMSTDSSVRGLVLKDAPHRTTVAFRTSADHKRKETIYRDAVSKIDMELYQAAIDKANAGAGAVPKRPLFRDRQQWEIPNQDETIGNVLKQALLEQGATASFTVVQNKLIFVCEIDSDSADAVVQSTLATLETHVMRLYHVASASKRASASSSSNINSTSSSMDVVPSK
jgi:hypothetical protein